MSDVVRYWDLQSEAGKTMEISLENGAVIRGVLQEPHGSHCHTIVGQDAGKQTVTVFYSDDVRTVTYFH